MAESVDRPILPGRCWWCSGPADSREHKFKRSDLRREHGEAPYVGGATLSRVTADGSSPMRSNKSDPLKFEPSICQRCNNARSQPFDRAYDDLVEWVFEHEEQVLDERAVNLEQALGADWKQRGLDVLRYFVKHICCRVADLPSPDRPQSVPLDLIAFLDGTTTAPSLTCEMYVEPFFLRWRDMVPNDPLWLPRPLWLEDVFQSGSRPDSMVQSRWHYGWLTLAWAVGHGVRAQHPFGAETVALPIVAASFAPPAEFALAAGRYKTDLVPESSPGTGRDTPGDQPPAMAWVFESPIAMSFLAGVLDGEAGRNDRAPDERTNVQVEPGSAVDNALELARLRKLAIGCAAQCGPQAIEAAAAAERAGVLIGIGTPSGQDQLLEAARLLGEAVAEHFVDSGEVMAFADDAVRSVVDAV